MFTYDLSVLHWLTRAVKSFFHVTAFSFIQSKIGDVYKRAKIWHKLQGRVTRKSLSKLGRLWFLAISKYRPLGGFREKGNIIIFSSRKQGIFLGWIWVNKGGNIKGTIEHINREQGTKKWNFQGIKETYYPLPPTLGRPSERRDETAV